MPIILIIGGVIIALGVGVFLFLSPGNTTTEPAFTSEVNVRVEEVEAMNDTEPVDTPDSGEPTAATGGPVTFRSSGEYLTPARTEHVVDVSLTLEAGVVRDATILFDGKAAGQYSNDNQARFADAYKAQVVGKPLGDISLSRVGGASLTSRAFNEAVVKIAAQATAENVVDVAL